MPQEVSVSGKIRVNLEIEWPHSFSGGAQAVDIYQTAARECKMILERALQEGKVKAKILGEVETFMVIIPVRSPK